jgi:hypothetical protein
MAYNTIEGIKQQKKLNCMDCIVETSFAAYKKYQQVVH